MHYIITMQIHKKCFGKNVGSKRGKIQQISYGHLRREKEDKISKTKNNKYRMDKSI